MRRTPLGLRIAFAASAVLVAALAALVWFGAVERWIAQELRTLAAAYLEPSFDFEALRYRFPSTVTLRGARLTSPDAGAASGASDILSVESLTLSLAEIPMPSRPLRMQRLELSAPTVRMVRTSSVGDGVRLLGYSDLVKPRSQPGKQPAAAPAKLSEIFQIRSVSIDDGRVAYDPRDGSVTVMLIEGIAADLAIAPSDAGTYGLDLSIDHGAVSSVAMKGTLLADDERLDVAAFSAALNLARENDHYLTPAVQGFLSRWGITGRLQLDASGTLDLRKPAASRIEAGLELDRGTVRKGDYGLLVDGLSAGFSIENGVATVERFTVDALGGHASVGGNFDLDGDAASALTFRGSDLQIGALLHGGDDPKGVPAFSGLLDFSGTLLGPLDEIGASARGSGHLTLKKARLGRLPVLSRIDEALDATAEALMKRERLGHDVASLSFRFEGDRAHLEKIRMNSRWYGLRGYGDVFFDSRLNLVVDGGPIQRLENELGPAGDVLGEITETLLRARITGTLEDPRVGIEILRQPTPF